jgi:hypothetical protein
LILSKPFENFRALIEDLMVANLVYWRRVILGKSQKNVFGRKMLPLDNEPIKLA